MSDSTGVGTAASGPKSFDVAKSRGSRGGLRAVGLRVQLGGVEIVRGVDLQVEVGSVVGLLGLPC